MAKQLNVNLAFTADTAQAKKQLTDLQKQLTSLINSSYKNNGTVTLSKELQEASVAAASLKRQLADATNVDTGKLDLGRLAQSMAQSGMSIEKYKNALISLGPEGTKAFASLAKSITMAEIPLKRSNTLLTQFATTLKNTLRWQVSSSLLHGFVGSIQSAYYYAEDLNESLNNIRIVTGQNTEQMARFAKEANEAAKALSTTTTEYTNASLIYYQQGLSDAEVKERTDATVKMANVTRTAAEEVSQQMTAIWNNFADGSKTLEYYSDVVTALGAATASSSAEIAEGLEKFSAVANTVGLSYEYATAALATVTATTRQSADVVGNAFKTLFARLESLKLGDTLDDGTDLNKYSQALAQVGVNIKDTNGQLKNMDTILDELGEKWTTLGKDQQMALASTVAGVRQYTQLIALMENWDFFQENVGVARGSEGTLQEQADIYAESWEAARDRVKAAAEEIYSQLLNDDFFIELNEGFGKALSVISGLIKGLGGVKGILLTLSTFIISNFKPQIITSLEDISYRFKMMTEAGRQSIQNTRNEANEQLSNLLVNSKNPMDQYVAKAYSSQATVQDSYLKNAEQMTEQQQKIAQILLDQHNTLVQNVEAQAEIAKETEKSYNNAVREQKVQLAIRQKSVNKLPADEYQETRKNIDLYGKQVKQSTGFATLIDSVFGNIQGDKQSYINQIESIKNALGGLQGVQETFGDSAANAFKKFETAIQNAEDDPIALDNAIEELYISLDGLRSVADQTGDELVEEGIDLKEITSGAEQAGKALGQLVADQIRATNSAASFEERLKKIPTAINSSLTSFVDFAQKLSAIAMVTSSVVSLVKTWNNEDMSGGEKLLQTLTTLGMIIPMITHVINQQTIAKIADKIATKALSITQKEGAASATAQGVANLFLNSTIAPLIITTLALTAAIGALIAIGYGIVKVVETIQAKSPEGQLKAATEAANDLNDSLSDAKSEAEELRGAFDQYDTVIDKLNECTKGTDAWLESLREVNNQVYDIVTQYPDLLQYMKQNKDNQLYFEQEDIDRVIAEAESKTSNLQIASLLANANVEGKQYNVKANDEVSGLADYVKELAGLSLEEFRDKYAELTGEVTFLSTESLVDLQHQIESLNSELEIVDNNFETLGELTLQQNFGDKYSKAASEMASSQYKKITEDIYKEALKSAGRGINVASRRDDEQVKAFWARYQKAAGINYELASNAVRGDDNNRFFAYLVNGETKEVSAQEMATTIAAYEAIEELGVKADEAAQTLSKLHEVAPQAASSIESWITTRDFTSLTKKQFDQLKGQFDEAGGTENYLQEILGGEEGVENFAKQLNLTTEGLVDALEKSFEGYEEELNKIKSSMYNTTRKVFEGLDNDIQDAAPATQKAIADLLNTAFENGGVKGLDTVAQYINTLNTDELLNFTSILSDINWDTTNFEDLKEQLKDAGIEADHLSNEDLANLINSLKKNELVARDASTAYQTLHEVIDDLANGATITQEQYDALGGNLYKSFFLKMADGTYKLTTDAQTFYDVVNQRSKEGFAQSIGYINAALKMLDGGELESSAFSFNRFTNEPGKGTSSAIYDSNKVQDQLAVLEVTGTDTTGWKDQIASGAATAETYQEIADAINSIDKDTLKALKSDYYEQYASTATSLSELHEMFDKDLLAEDEQAVYAFTKAAMAMDAATDTKNLDPKELAEYTEYLQEASQYMEGFNDEMSKDEATIVAKGIMKMNDAIETLSSNWENWSDILDNSTETSEEYMQAMSGSRQAVANLLDISEEYVSSDFILDHLEEIRQAAEGNAEAIDNLKEELSENVIAKIILDNQDFINDVDEVKSLYDNLVASIPDIDVGVSLDGESEFVKTLDALIAATGMTVDQVNALCDSMGFEANFASEPQDVGGTITRKTIHHTVMPAETPEEYANRGATSYDEVETVELEEIPYEGTATAFSMTTDGSAPQIKSVTKKAGGSANNHSSSNKGGGGGGGGSKKPSHKDPVKDKPDRYYDINNAISSINEELERNAQLQQKLGALQDHYHGEALIKSLEQENELLQSRNTILESQYSNYEKLYEIQSQELGELKGKIGGEWDGNVLQNYSDLFQANVDRYNAAIEAYNNMSAEEQEASGNQMIEDAKEAYDTYKDALDRYQDLYYNEMYDTENKLAELRQQLLENHLKIIENNLKSWEVKVQLKLDTTKLEREWNKFLHDMETDFRKVYKNLTIDSLNSSSDFMNYLDDVETKMQQIRDVEAEIDRMEAAKNEDGVVVLSDDMMFGSISEAQEKLKELQSELIDANNSLREAYKQTWDNYLEGLEQAAKNFEDIGKKFEHINNQLEYEKELIELIYGDKAFDLMSQYYEIQRRNIETQIDSTRQQAEFWEDQFRKAYEMNKEEHGVSLDDMSTWTEDMKKAYDQMISSQEELNNLVIEGIKTLQDEYLNNVAKAFNEMDNAIWGMDFTRVKEDWDFIQKRADEYLDDVEGAYKIQTLANKIDMSISETSSLQAQQKLAKLRENEIDYLREKENLTQDDIDLAEARYQIALKEIALEDAQNNKTSMKLTRDTSGNWTYQYVADDEDVKNKQQELLDAYNNLYETADNAYNHAMNLAMETYEEMQARMQEVANDMTLTEEQKQQRIQEIYDEYLPLIDAAFENSQLYQQEVIYATGAVFAEVCEQDEDAYISLTDTQKALVDEIKNLHLDDYEEIREAIQNAYGNIKDYATDAFRETNENSKTVTADIIRQWDKGKDSVKEAVHDAFISITQYTSDYIKKLEELEKASGHFILDEGGVVSDIDKIGDAINEVGDDTEEMVDRMDDSLDELRGFVDEVANCWDGVIGKIQEAIATLREYIQTMSDALSTVITPDTDFGDADVIPDNGGGGDGGSGGGNGGSGGGGGGSSSNEKKMTVIGGQTGRNLGTMTMSEAEARWGEDYGDIYTNGKYIYVEELKTGGYTGSWDDTSGRLAVLHQKELVLNATDTENMLQTVNAVRDISKLNDSIGQTIASAIGNLIVNTMFNAGKNINSSSSNNTSNVFNITAEFPNADDVQTIRDAILSLPNIASQFVHES